MNIYKARNDNTLAQANRLLYRVLWEPLGLEANTRDSLKADGVEHIIVAADDDNVFGAFVLVASGENKVELRHAAVSEVFQNKGIGKRLWSEAVALAIAEGARELTLYARNTTIGYWLKMGLTEGAEWLDHEMFKKHGIRFKKMSYCLKNSGG